jgi:hypothetical protein
VFSSVINPLFIAFSPTVHKPSDFIRKTSSIGTFALLPFMFVNEAIPNKVS